MGVREIDPEIERVPSSKMLENHKHKGIYWMKYTGINGEFVYCLLLRAASYFFDFCSLSLSLSLSRLTYLVPPHLLQLEYLYSLYALLW